MIHLLVSVSVLDLLRFWLNMQKEHLEASKLSNLKGRNWLLFCHITWQSYENLEWLY